jgi:hypothetical protein
MSRGKLKETTFPFLEESIKDKPQDIIILVIGGITYAEIEQVHRMNKTSGMRVVLGGTNVLNSDMYLKSIKDNQRYL